LIGTTQLNNVALGIKYTPTSSDYFQLRGNGDMYTAGQVQVGNSLTAPDAQFNVSFNTNNPTPPLYQLAVVNTTSTPTDVFTIDNAGNTFTAGSIGIGFPPSPSFALDVKGVIRAEEVRVCPSRTCDFVFDNTYKLMTLDTLNAYLKLNHHLPGIASAKEMEAAGTIGLGEMNMNLLQKVEELTLYTIQQKQQVTQQQTEIEKQNEKIKELETKLDLLVKQVQK